MWQLSELNATGKVVNSWTLYAGQSAVIGRKDAAIDISHLDKSISRRHAQLSVAHPQPAQVYNPEAVAACKIKDLSKFGTNVYRDPDRTLLSQPGGETELQDGDIIVFGASATEFRVQYLPLVACARLLDAVTQDRVTRKAAEIGGHILRAWGPVCTHIIADSSLTTVPASMDAIRAVASDTPFITSRFLDAITSRPSFSLPPPDPSRFAPPLRFLIGPDNEVVEMDHTKERRKLFQGLTFLFGTAHLYPENLTDAVIRAGGQVDSLAERRKGFVETQTSLRKLVFVDSGEDDRMLTTPAAAFARQIRWTNYVRIGRTILTANIAFLEMPQRAIAGQAGHQVQTLAQSPTKPRRSRIDSDSDDDTQEEADVSPRLSPANFLLPTGSVRSQELGQTVQKLGPLMFSTTDGQVVSRKRPSEDMGAATPSSLVTPIIVSDLRDSELPSGEHFACDGEAELLVLRPLGGTPLSGCSPTSAVAPSRFSDARETKIPRIEEPERDVVIEPLVVRQADDDVPITSQGTGGTNFKVFRKVQHLAGNSVSSLVPFANENYRDSTLEGEYAQRAQEVRQERSDQAAADALFQAEKLKRTKVTAAEAAAKADQHRKH
eukprot:jgi/Chlat1/5583/Chrsp369S00852